MIKIPEDKGKFPIEKLTLLPIRVVNPTLILRQIATLELELVREALQTIRERGIEVLITQTPRVYESDRASMASGGNIIYLLCDEEGFLRDLSPLMPFVPKEKRDLYESVRAMYLNIN